MGSSDFAGKNRAGNEWNTQEEELLYWKNLGPPADDDFSEFSLTAIEAAHV